MPLPSAPPHSPDTSETAGPRPDGAPEHGSEHGGLAAAWATVPARERILATAGLLVLLQVAFRAWALYPSWFYTDDYRFLSDARAADLDLDYLFAPFDSQLMPFGRALAWLVADSGQVNWALAATCTLLLQLLASLACLWMLTTLFGVRWGVLAPLSVYLFGAMTMPALMWWAAALNQVPLQAVLFGSVACWVRYLRGEGWRWLALTLLLLALGLTAYVKTVLVFVILAYLLLAYFVDGGPLRRVGAAVRRFWPAALGAVVLGATYTAYYVAEVPSIFTDADRPVAGSLAETMLGSSFTTGLLGGPWRWNTANAPAAQAAPPAWSVHLSWALIALALVALALLRRRTGRAWLLLAGHLAVAYLLVLTSRAPVAGGFIGSEYRYLTDVAAIVPLCLALAALPLRGSTQPSEPRQPALLLVRPGPRTVAALTVAVCVSGLLTSRAYVSVWHDDNPGDEYVHRAAAELQLRGTVDLADQVLPPEVIPGFSAPYNTTGRLVPLIDNDVRFPEVSSRLMLFDEDGTLQPAAIDAAATSRPGPDGACGWQVGRGSVTVPLDARTFDFEWWVRLDYRALGDTEVSARIGTTTRTLPLRQGLNTLWLRADGELSSVTLRGLRDDDVLVCVDEIQVGLLEPDEAANEEDR